MEGYIRSEMTGSSETTSVRRTF